MLFLDLRQEGHPYEKKYVELPPEDRAKAVNTYHNWQQVGHEQSYRDIPEYCYSATLQELADKDYSLVPSKYIEFQNRDENFDYQARLSELQTELSAILAEEEKSRQELKALFDELGFTLD